MKYSLISAGVVALAAAFVQAGDDMTSCVCSEVVEWETETVTVTVAPGYQTPTSCPIATIYPTSCTECGYTVVGTLPQYVVTEICTSVTCSGGSVLPTTYTTGSTCMVNTVCTVDKNGKTESLLPTTHTVTACSFPSPTLLPPGCEWDTCLIPEWVIDADGHKETIPPCTATYTWYPPPTYHPTTRGHITKTFWNGPSPVISVINDISINIIIGTGQVWCPGTSTRGSQPTGPSSNGGHGHGHGGSPTTSGGNGGGPSSTGGAPSSTPFLLAASNGEIGIIEDLILDLVPSDSPEVAAFTGFYLVGTSLTDGFGNVALVDTGLIGSDALSPIVFAPSITRLRRRDNSTQTTTVTWDISTGLLEAFFDSAPCFFYVCENSEALFISLNAAGGAACVEVTLTPEPLSSFTAPSSSGALPASSAPASTGGAGAPSSAAGIPTSGAAAPTSSAPTSVAGAPTSTPSSAAGTPVSSAAGPTVTSTPSSTASTTIPSSAASSSSTAIPTDFPAAMVYWHNLYRARHGVGPVTWNDTLATYAANYSSFCQQGHSGSPYYGENLAYGGFTNPSYYVYLWYDEIVTGPYDFNDPGFSLSTGHFTQVVWKDSVQIGCGWVVNQCQDALGSSFPNYLTCEYYPYGNVDGEFAEEVLPPITSDPIPVPAGDL